MKIFASSFLLCILLNTASAQDYFKVGDMWVQRSTCDSGTPFCVIESKVNIKITADTTIADTIFYELTELSIDSNYHVGPGQDNCGEGNYNFGALGFVYQIGKKVWFKEDLSRAGELVYDFTLQPSDTMKPSMLNRDQVLVVTSVDTIDFGSFKRVKINYEDTMGHQPGYLIEGIGSAAGFMAPIDWGVNCNYEMNCFSSSTHSYPIGSPCSGPLNLKDIYKEEIQIFPNPTDGKLLLSNLPESGGSIQVFSFLGAIVLERQFSASPNPTEIDLSFLTQGVYYLVVVNKNQTLSLSQKITLN